MPAPDHAHERHVVALDRRAAPQLEDRATDDVIGCQLEHGRKGTVALEHGTRAVEQRDAVGDGVEGGLPLAGQRAHRLLGPPHPPERVDGRDQHRRLHRLREVGVGSALEAERAVTGAHERRRQVDDGDRRRRRVGLDATTYLEAAHVGQVDVEQHDGGFVRHCDLQGLVPPRRLPHVETRLLEDLGARVAPGCVVVDVEQQRAGRVHAHERV